MANEPDDEGKALGRRIRELREARGWSQVEFAKMAKLSRPTLRRYEDGEVAKTAELANIAAALGLRTFALLLGNEERLKKAAMEKAASEDAEAMRPRAPGEEKPALAGEEIAAYGRDLDALMHEIEELPAKDRRTMIAHMRGLLAGRKLSK